ncbi:DUF1707 domain-containing protein [Nocardioides sp. Root151]|uniref:DUF1707 SHOCT-like domain-containing protein n=1 Tax=Nocardioides sp. Root151 TaxID=1736475 RepID=UPI000702AA2B|nr:DUF1707 domain-containing protein [Nocardioides sp. Root151]KQZ70279.1 hypothetical protein ASD66_11600 [Nocardioides sp. Root151]
MSSRPARKRARQSDRDAVVDALSGAFADGQIDAADHDRMVSSALRADRLDSLVAVLDEVQVPERHPANALVTKVQAPAVRRTPGHSRAATVGATVAVLVGGFVALLVVVGLMDRDDEPGDEPVLTATALEALVADVEDDLGTTEVLAVETHGTYADVLVPTDEGRGRFDRYSYDPGADDTLTESTGGRVGTADPELVDLADVDLDRLLENVEEAGSDLGVDGAQEFTVTIASGDWGSSLTYAPEFEGKELPPHVEISVSNDYMESGRLVTDLSGAKVLLRAPFAAPSSQ